MHCIHICNRNVFMYDEKENVEEKLSKNYFQHLFVRMEISKIFQTNFILYLLSEICVIDCVCATGYVVLWVYVCVWMNPSMKAQALDSRSFTILSSSYKFHYIIYLYMGEMSDIVLIWLWYDTHSRFFSLHCLQRIRKQ